MNADFANSWMAVVFVVAIVVESAVSAYGHFKWYELKDTGINLLFASLNFGIDLVFKGVTFFVLNWFHQFAFFSWTNHWILWPCLIVLEDLAYYTLHWVDHNVRFFWAVHVNHHSSQKMNFSVAIRSSVLQPLYRFVYFIPLALLGFEAWQIIFAYLVCNWWGFFIHTESIGKLGFLEKIMATPSNHRVHHGSNPHYLDRNMGMLFIIWDRIFNTYQEEDEKVVYGLTKNIDSNRLDDLLFHEWKQMWVDVNSVSGFQNKWMYVFGPPGWSHDGSRKTSQQLRSEYFEKLYSTSQIPDEVTETNEELQPAYN
jgi:sterol desaturase/sphingolipid hydroxylase (fatty acid hydroxylase superfamily)